MLWPLLACLVLTGIHVYLGVHVIARKVIFVDLALAQIAALGTVIGVLLGYEPGNDTMELYLYSLAFTIFGAFIFSVTKMKGEKVPHEAIIGIVYAVTFASTMLVLSRSALGPQELDHIIKGELLWVQPPMVIKTAIIYALVGSFHFIFRKKFMAISFETAGAEMGGLNTRLWDFLFYMSFGFVITSSVSIAGVFLVFSYLIIPAVGAMLLSDKLGTRLAIGWVGGSMCSFIGVKLSWNTGLPTSPLVVCVLASALIVSGVYRYVRTAPSRIAAAGNLAKALAVIALFIVAVLLFRKREEDPLEHTLHLLKSRLSTDRVTAIAGLKAFPDKKGEWLEEARRAIQDEDAQVRKAAVDLAIEMKDTTALLNIRKLLYDNSDAVLGTAVRAIRIMGSVKDGKELHQAALQATDPELQLELLKTSLDLGTAESIPLLAAMVVEGGIFSGEAFQALKERIPYTFKENEADRVIHWYRQNLQRLRWSPDRRMFELARRDQRR